MPRASLRRFSVPEYHRMIETGVLAEGDSVELLDGWIVEKMPRTPPHDAGIDLARDAVEPLLPAGWRLRIQSAITLSDSEPEPDLVVVRGPARRYTHQHPRAGDIALIIEVASSSIDDDRDIKGPIYATAGIRWYWLVNLIEGQVEVFSDPVGSIYTTTKTYAATESIPLVIDGVTVGMVPVGDLLP